MSPVVRRFPPKILAAVQKDKIVGIQAGGQSHRVIGIWAVVVDGRVFVRSWAIGRKGWWRTLLDVPHGVLHVGDKKIKVRAIQIRSEHLKDKVSEAYAVKYNTPGSVQYVKDMSRKRSRDTTTELVPA